MKKNRITDIIITTGVEEQKLQQLQTAIDNNPNEKAKAEKEFFESLEEQVGEKINRIKEEIGKVRRYDTIR